MLHIDTAEITVGFHDACEDALSNENLHNTYKAFFKQCNISMFTYHYMPPIGACDNNRHVLINISGIPDEAVGCFEGDPIFRLMQLNGFPIWKSDLINYDWDSTQESEYYKFACRLDLEDFLLIPVYGPAGHNGYFLLGFKSLPNISYNKLRRLLSHLCQTVHLRQIKLNNQLTHETLKLTPRELEILKLVTHGKSNPCIAEILGISATTVNSYLRHCYLKLRVYDRVTASLRAVALGLV